MTRTVERRLPSRLSRLLIVACWILYLITFAVVVAQVVSYEIASMLANGAFVAVGTLLMVRRPGNVIGPLLAVTGLGWNVMIAADVTAEGLLDSGQETSASWVAFVFATPSTVLLWLFIPLIVLFPHGRVPSVASRRFLQVTGVWAFLVSVFSAFTSPALLDPTALLYEHPFVEDDLARSLADVYLVLSAPIVLLQIVVAVLLVRRYRTSGPIERRQIGWVAYAAITWLVISLINVFISPLGTEDRAFLLLDGIGFVLVPLAIGVAIFRYRLYDIDVIISKSVMYLGLLASITAVYAAVVVVPLLVIGASDGDGPGLLLPIVATAVVAVLFEPIRSRMQRWANRLVYGNRSTPHEVLSRVTARLAESAGASTDELARLVAMGTGAEHAVVSIVTESGTIPSGHWSVNASSTAALTESGELTAVVDVLHDGERLGTVSITKPPNDPITPADRELLDDVAASAGLLLRNIRLNKELEDRAADVRESRRRLIEAQDRERHRLERDLHDGAQQQVVALKVKLGIAKTVAQRENAPDIADHLIGLADISQVAVDALRHVAHGIYPPLLESEGLEPALRAVGRTSALPIELNAVDIDRYARSTEETAYFCVTETLERARMSGATSARVAVAGRNGDLITSIDLGSLDTELDLRAVADRLDAAGGSLMIEDEPDRGRCVVSSLPVAPFEGETS